MEAILGEERLSVDNSYNIIVAHNLMINGMRRKQRSGESIEELCSMAVCKLSQTAHKRLGN